MSCIHYILKYYSMKRFFRYVSGGIMLGIGLGGVAVISNEIYWNNKYKYHKSAVTQLVFPTDKQWVDAIMEDEWLITKNVPQKILTPEFYNKFIKEYPTEINVIPENMITNDMCENIAKNYNRSINVIPKKMFTPKICKIIIDTCPFYIDLIPIDAITGEINTMLYDLIKKNSVNIQYLSKEMITLEMCDYISIHSPTHLHLIPQNMITLEICKSIAKRGWPVYLIPPDMITTEMRNQLIEHRLSNIVYLPEHMITYEMCKKVARYAHVYAYKIPSSMFTEEIMNILTDRNLRDFSWLNKISMNQIPCAILIKFKNNSVFVQAYCEHLCALQNLSDINNLHDPLGHLPTEFLEMCKIKYFEGLCLTKEQFTKYFPDTNLQKVTNSTEIHNSYQFKTGLNVENAFNPKTNCTDGIYFTSNPREWGYLYGCVGGEKGRNVSIFFDGGKKCFIRDVTLADGAIIKIEKNKFKSNKIILGERREYLE